VRPPDSGQDWLALTEQPLSVGDAYEWSVQDDCGAVVLFSGTVRNHAVDDDGRVREGVGHLTYEAYDSQVVPRLAAIAAEVRVRWPRTGRIVLWHRIGRIELGETSVIVVVSAPHRPEAFAAAQYSIDAIKATAPIWKHEEWVDGADWGTGAHAPVDATAVPSPASSLAQLQPSVAENTSR
jgi:molybdopterin synthase catalytic subunit